MLAIRLKRTGRKGHAQFRVIVQDSHFHPSRGRVVAYLGNYNPHDKSAQLNTELASKYLDNGAQPSDRVAKLLQSEGVKLPEWVKLSDPKKRAIRNPEKLRRNQPKEKVAPAVPEAETAPEVPEAPAAEITEELAAPVEESAAEAEAPVEEAETPVEVPAEETSPEAEIPAPSDAKKA